MPNKNGASLSEIIRSEINLYPYLKASLSDGVINYSALARKLMPTAQARLGKKVNEESIIVSIKRYADEITGKEKGKNLLEYFANSEINLQGNVCYAKFRKNERTLARIEKLMDDENWNIGETRMIMESPDQIAALLNDNRLTDMKNDLKDDLIYHANNSSILTVRMPMNSFVDFGIIAEISSILAKKGISIHVMSSPTDIHFIISEDDADKAYRAINDLLHSSKRALEEKNNERPKA